MLFLSASIPMPGREYYETANILAIREAVMAFTKVCMELEIPFYFGGHPAISPLVYQIAKEYNSSFSSNIIIYQSLYFKNQTPPEVSYYQNIVWTEKKETIDLSIEHMRKEMFKTPTECAVFIGGMEGIIKEAKLIHSIQPSTKLLPIINTGGACADLPKQTELKCDSLTENECSYAYVYLLREYLKQFTTLKSL